MAGNRVSMVKKSKRYQQLIVSQKNVRFSQFVTVVEAFGFELDRIRGSHHTYKHPAVTDAFLVLQPGKNGQAQPYQIKQFLRLVEAYDLRLTETEEDSGDDN